MSAPEVLQPKTYRLSVIVSAPSMPTLNRRALAERAVQSVLDQADPIGTEVVYVDDGSRELIGEHLESVFGEVRSSGKLTIVRDGRIVDAGKLRNIGIQHAQGAALAFLSTDDYWRPGRLAALEPWLSRHDLILSVERPVPESSDWVQTLLEDNYVARSSGVIRRSLLEEVGGFPERMAGLEEYEFWIRCLVKLSESERRERFVLLHNEHIVSEPSPLAATPVAGMLDRVQRVREMLTLVHVAPRLPRRYWLGVAKQIGSRGKSLLKGRKP